MRYFAISIVVFLVMLTGCEQVAAPRSEATELERAARFANIPLSTLDEDGSLGEALTRYDQLRSVGTSEGEAAMAAALAFHEATTPFLYADSQQPLTAEAVEDLHAHAQALIARLDTEPARLVAQSMIGRHMLVWILPRAQEPVPDAIRAAAVEMLVESVSDELGVVTHHLEQMTPGAAQTRELATRALANLGALERLAADDVRFIDTWPPSVRDMNQPQTLDVADVRARLTALAGR